MADDAGNGAGPQPAGQKPMAASNSAYRDPLVLASMVAGIIVSLFLSPILGAIIVVIAIGFHLKKGGKLKSNADVAKFAMWRIVILLIIVAAVILAVMFALLLSGVFSPSAGRLISYACVAAPGFLCTSPAFAATGNLSVVLGQSTGETMYNVGIGCAASSLPNGLPNPQSAIDYLSSSGSATPIPMGPIPGMLSLASGQTVSVSGLKCFGASGQALSSLAAGTEFSGGIWLNYTLNSSAPGPSNPLLTQKISSVTVKVA